MIELPLTYFIPSYYHGCPCLGCKISTIDPSSLSSSIGWLILTDNKIQSLPDTIGNLKGLRKFMLSGNELSSLPESMKHCRELELLRLSSNRFEHLPKWLFELPKLAWFAFSGNPLNAGIATDSSSSNIDFDEFVVAEKLGEGTSGIVSKAYWRSRSIEVALKLFKSSSTSDGNPS